MIEDIFSHRSIRKFKDRAIPEDVMRRILEAGIRASNTGNMQVYSIIVTTDPGLRERLAPCHFNQPCAKQAAAILTFCADINRFSRWSEHRGAKPEYDNFLWFLNGAIDTVLASQNVALAAESEGLGICYLGTTTYTADKIIEVLDLPWGVVPVTTIVMGYPDENPPLTDRLPLDGVVHTDRYEHYSPQRIDEIWAEKEASELTASLIRENGLPNLARIFAERRYKGEDSRLFSGKYLDVLRRQGFLKQQD